MKTADLIPLILLELNECDKYGFELTKAIETKSNEKIVIKQPTLYTLLKKLEKSKFIASYWQDSDIGGKRHYYKLTENGKLQVSTLPSYQLILANIFKEDDEQNEFKSEVLETCEISPIKESPIESILPVDEVFSENNIDNSTEYDINFSNAEILKNSSDNNEEQFATNADVMKFTEKIQPTSLESINIPSKNKNIDDVFEKAFEVPKNNFDVKFIDYVDLKNNDTYKYSKNISKKIMQKSLLSSSVLILMLLIFSIITTFTSITPCYCVCFITAALISVFYPIIILSNIKKIRLKYKTNTYNSKLKLRLLIATILFLIVLIVSIIININIGNNSIKSMLGIKNFANFYVPLLISSTCFIDVLFNYLLLSKVKK